MNDLEKKDTRELLDMVYIRLELLEKDVSEMAKSEGSRGKLIAINELTEEIRDILNIIRTKCWLFLYSTRYEVLISEIRFLSWC